VLNVATLPGGATQQPKGIIKSRSGITSRGFATIPGRGVDVVDLGHVRFGSEANIAASNLDVRFTPKADMRRHRLDIGPYHPWACAKKERPPRGDLSEIRSDAAIGRLNSQ
jgi:hypothetical protein